MRLLAFMLLLAGLACSHAVQERQLFYPRAGAALPEASGRKALAIPVAGGVLKGYALCPEGSRAWLLYFYGNGEQASRVLAKLEGLSRAHRVGVVCLDYRGYGASEGQPGLRALQEDALRIFDATSDLRGGLPTVAMGYSIGTWGAVHLAAHRPVAGLILAAPFSAYLDLLPAAQKLVPWYVRPFVRLKVEASMEHLVQPLQEMPGVRAPLLLLQGEADTLTRPICSEHMLEAAASPSKRLVRVPGAGHNDLSFHAEPLASALRDFLDGVSAGAAGAPAGGGSAGQ